MNLFTCVVLKELKPIQLDIFESKLSTVKTLINSSDDLCKHSYIVKFSVLFKGHQ